MVICIVVCRTCRVLASRTVDYNAMQVELKGLIT